MKKYLNRKSLQMSAAFTAGYMLTSTQAHANDFSSISSNIVTSMSDIPGLLTGCAYMFGILLGVLGILKIKDHVENPNNTPLKDGAIRLAAGGGLFALPIIYEAMLNTIGVNGANAQTAVLNKVSFATQ
jgi:hypothetical protein